MGEGPVPEKGCTHAAGGCHTCGHTVMILIIFLMSIYCYMTFFNTLEAMRYILCLLLLFGLLRQGLTMYVRLASNSCYNILNARVSGMHNHTCLNSISLACPLIYLMFLAPGGTASSLDYILSTFLKFVGIEITFPILSKM